MFVLFDFIDAQNKRRRFLLIVHIHRQPGLLKFGGPLIMAHASRNWNF
jgi:hypothetical protein